jgi:hypothetical protein
MSKERIFYEMFRPMTIACFAMPGVLFAQAFSDGFEGPSLDPFWTQVQQYGTVSLSADQPHAGAQALKISSISGGQRDSSISHQYASPLKGTFTIYFYDYAPGQETLYQYFSLSNSALPNQFASIGVDDYDAFCYKAGVQSDAGPFTGPGQSCGVYPGPATTNVARSIGWHRFDIEVLPATVVLKIDGVTVHTFAGDLSFDRVRVSQSGPFWRPNTITYVDDFSYTPPANVYNISLLYDETKAVKSGATIPIKLQLCDANSVNQSAASIVLHATGLVQVSTNTSEVIQDAGNANPDSDFRYDSTLGGTGGYIFNLKTTGLSSGTYRLSFTAGGDPAVYSVQFKVK